MLSQNSAVSAAPPSFPPTQRLSTSGYQIIVDSVFRAVMDTLSPQSEYSNTQVCISMAIWSPVHIEL